MELTEPSLLFNSHATLIRILCTYANSLFFTTIAHYWQVSYNLARYSPLLSTPYRLPPTYILGNYYGTVMHWTVRYPYLLSSSRMPYVVAALRYMGGDFYGTLDSSGDAACLVVARAMGSQSWAADAELLLQWLLRRDDADYVPCERTRLLCNL